MLLKLGCSNLLRLDKVPTPAIWSDRKYYATVKN
jgi:hypothetical protein